MSGESNGGVTSEDLGQFADSPKDLTDKAIRTTEDWVDLGPDIDKTAWHSKLQLVGFGMKQGDAQVNGLAGITAQAVLGDDAQADLDLHPKAEHTHED